MNIVSQVIAYALAHNRYASFFGLFFVLFCLYGLSTNRRMINWRLVLSAIGLHIFFALFMIKTSIGHVIMSAAAAFFSFLYTSAGDGISFVFGKLFTPQEPWGFIFALRVLPIIVFFGALMAVLSYYGVICSIVNVFRKIIQPLLGTKGAETTCAVANMFLGQTEAPLVIRDYIAAMSPSELFVVMVSGMGTISVGLLAVLGSMGVPVTHLLAASLMSVPVTIMCAKIVVPASFETTAIQKEGVALSSCEPSPDVSPKSVFDAISSGTADGLSLALNVGAMLIVFIALIGLINALFGYVSDWGNSIISWSGSSWHLPVLSLQKILGYAGLPFGWMFGFTGREAVVAGELLGLKVVMNELVAYSTLVCSGLSGRAIIIMSYALCGFSNLSSIGIQVGGIGVLAPNQRAVLSRLGMRCVIVAALANIYSAMLINIVL